MSSTSRLISSLPIAVAGSVFAFACGDDAEEPPRQSNGTMGGTTSGRAGSGGSSGGASGRSALDAGTGGVASGGSNEGGEDGAGEANQDIDVGAGNTLWLDRATRKAATPTAGRRRERVKHGN